MNKLNSLAKQRAARRLLKANECASRIVNDAQRMGVQMSVVGSLANNSFRAHSDIDLLVHGSNAAHRRAPIERLVAQHLRGTGLPYDLIFEADLTEERLKEMLHGV